MTDQVGQKLQQIVRRGSTAEEQGCAAFHPTYASFTVANSHHPNHTAQTRALHAYLRRRNAATRHPPPATRHPPPATRHRSLNDPTNLRDHNTGEQGFTGQANRS
ncbi:hypothetical protein ACH4MU_19420 [Streptomyces albidoflavus]